MNTSEFNGLCDTLFAELLKSSPEVAAELGVLEMGGHRIAQRGFSDPSPEGVAARRALMEEALKTLTDMDDARLNADQQLSRDLFIDFLRHGFLGSLRGLEARGVENCEPVLNHLTGAHAEVLDCLSDWHSLSDPERVDEFLERLDAVPGQLNAVRIELERRRAQSNLVPGTVLTRVREQLAGWLEQPLDEDPILLHLSAGLDNLQLDAIKSRSVLDQAKRQLERRVRPAFQALGEYLAQEYPANENRIGLCRLPDGPDYYASRLRASTTTTRSAEDIHQLGQIELATLRDSIHEDLARLGYANGSFAQRLAAFENDPQFSIPPSWSRAEVLAKTEAIIDSIREPFLETLGVRPRGELKVLAIPEHREASRHSLYTPPASDGSRPGIFHLNISHLRNGSLHGLTTVTYHETFPGHHCQLCIAQELTGDLPDFRRAIVHDAYIEGWAKYAEMLPWLERFNRDEYWNLSRRRNELFSTANLVLDTGIHHYGWTRDAGIDFFVEQTASTRNFAEMIVDRITAVPGQVCAYKIGMLSVLGLRERLRVARGANFDIREFHDLVLNKGSMPLSMLEARIERAITGTASVP